MQSLDKLVRRWNSEDLDALPAYGESIVRATFLEIGIEPPADLVRLYRAIGGMAGPDCHQWRLWSLSEVCERRAEANAFGMLFSDYMLDAWAYRAKPIDAATTAVYLDYYDDQPSLLIAHALDQFFDLYLRDAIALLEEPEILSAPD